VNNQQQHAGLGLERHELYLPESLAASSQHHAHRSPVQGCGTAILPRRAPLMRLMFIEEGKRKLGDGGLIDGLFGDRWLRLHRLAPR
jgi:hypothetical protein